jgi:hypothetical protein
MSEYLHFTNIMSSFFVINMMVCLKNEESAHCHFVLFIPKPASWHTVTKPLCFLNVTCVAAFCSTHNLHTDAQERDSETQLWHVASPSPQQYGQPANGRTVPDVSRTNWQRGILEHSTALDHRKVPETSNGSRYQYIMGWRGHSSWWLIQYSPCSANKWGYVCRI